MQMQALRLRIFACVAGVAMLACSGWANADPPSRVARLGYISGAVSFSPAGESDWDQATINRPLSTGDRLWADSRARAEIQIGGAMIRMSAGTGVSILNLDDRIAQLQLTEGILNVRVRRLDPNQLFEVDTPNLAFTLRKPGEYRIEVDPDGNATTIFVRKGQGEVYGEDASYVIDSRQPYRFTGTGLREYQYVAAPALDEFDRWSSERDRNYDNSRSARYVSQDVVGYQDLDANGAWSVDASYGNVWFPNRVATGWAPYRDGHWVWVDPWGWTWMDDAPWGFAVSHYGRWTHLRGAWCWVPGPVRTHAYYAPALVAFIGGDNFQLSISGGNVGGVAWFPLGPREVYRPSYHVSRGYFENINRSNTVISSTVINNYYNNVNVTNVVYANRQVPGAVIAVPTTAFVQSLPVAKAAVRVSREMMVSAPVAAVAAVAPTDKSVRGAAVQGGKPPVRVFERPVVARSAPPAAHSGFAAQQQQLISKPGRPLDDAARKELKHAATAPTPVVKVIAQKQAAPPTMAPPLAGPSARHGDVRGKSDERKLPAAPAISSAPAAPTPGATPLRVAPPAPAAKAQEPRGESEQRGKGVQRAQPIAPPPPPPQRGAPVQTAPAQIGVPTAKPPEQRGKTGQPDRGEQRGSSAASAPATSRGAAQPQAVRPQATPPVPSAQPAEPRGRSEQLGNGQQRGRAVAPPPAPAQRAVEAKVAPPHVAPTAPAMQAPPQRSAQPNVAPSPQGAPPAPAAKQAEPRPPAAAPKPPPQPQPTPRAEPRGQESKPAAAKPDDKKNDGDEPKHEKENRKQEK